MIMVNSNPSGSASTDLVLLQQLMVFEQVVSREP